MNFNLIFSELRRNLKVGESMNFIEKFIQELENEKEKKNNDIKEYTVDRFEEDFAVLEDRKTKEMINIKKDKLPTGIKEGNIIVRKNGKFIEDEKIQKNIENRIEDKMKNLWND